MLVNCMRRTIKKMEKLSVSWVVAEKLLNHIEIADYYFFSLEKSIFISFEYFCNKN